MLEIGEYVKKKLPELNVVAVVAAPMHVGRIVAVQKNFSLFVFAEDDSLFFHGNEFFRQMRRCRFVERPFDNSAITLGNGFVDNFARIGYIFVDIKGGIEHCFVNNFATIESVFVLKRGRDRRHSSFCEQSKVRPEEVSRILSYQD